ncbi:MAG: NUDIX hydrolase [Cytophagales bacterium]|nr:MAG: NUDIX hydrolase [Cytophagales bacterium]
MIVFIDDRPIRLVHAKKATQFDNLTHYDQIVDARLEILKDESLRGHLLILNATPTMLEKVVYLVQNVSLTDLQSITLLCPDKEACEARFTGLFKVVKAAGGVVFNGDKMLLMFRRKVWDLPKGKLDGGETSREGAAREVEEETGCKVAVEDKICTTWHTYAMNGSRILKRTKWYRMRLLDDSKMAPQEDEDIEKLAWLDRKEAQLALTNSFSSIRYVMEQVYTAQTNPHSDRIGAGRE